MDETQIAEKLRKNIPVPPPSDGTTDPEPPKPEEIDLYHQVSHPLENTVLKQQLSDYLDLTPSSKLNPEIQDKIETLLEWAVNESQSKDLADILEIIGKRQGEMGIRHKSDKLSLLYRDIKLSKQMRALQLQREALYD